MDIGVERYSTPFFFEPFYAAQIPTNILDGDNGPEEEPLVYGDWVIDKMTTQFGEFKDMFKKREKQAH